MPCITLLPLYYASICPLSRAFLSNVEVTHAADFSLSREVCFVKTSEEVLYVLLYTHCDHLRSIVFRVRSADNGRFPFSVRTLSHSWFCSVLRSATHAKQRGFSVRLRSPHIRLLVVNPRRDHRCDELGWRSIYTSNSVETSGSRRRSSQLINATVSISLH